MVFWVKYALTVAAMGAFLASCSENLEKVSTEELTPPADDPSAVHFLRTAPVVFTEVNPKNATFEDEDGDHSDWIELFNPADTAVNLKGFSLSNSESEPRKWTFGNAVIPPQSFLIVFFSKKDRPELEAPSDSTDLLGFDSWSWSDAESSPVKGASIVKPWLSSEYISTENG